MNACMQPENAVLSFITCVRGLGCACLSLRFPDTYFTFLSPHVHFQVPIGRAEEVEEVFDAISYCKGASVVSANKGAMGGWVETVAVEGWASLLLQPGKSCSASAFISFLFGLAFIFHFLAPPPPGSPALLALTAQSLTPSSTHTHTTTPVPPAIRSACSTACWAKKRFSKACSSTWSATSTATLRLFTCGAPGKKSPASPFPRCLT